MQLKETNEESWEIYINLMKKFDPDNQFIEKVFFSVYLVLVFDVNVVDK